MNVMGSLIAAFLWAVGQTALHRFNALHLRRQKDQIEELTIKVDRLLDILEPKG